MTRRNHILIVGASGVIGTGAVEHFTGLGGWEVTAISRRPPVVADDGFFSHLPLDLTDPERCCAVIGGLRPVTHLIYAAVAEAPGLSGGWYDRELIAANGAMFANVIDPLSVHGSLGHVSLLQGAKAYGAHHHPVEVPCREDQSRDDHPNFYWLHEDRLRLRAREAGFAFTIFRPQVLLGAAPGAAMNPVAPIGAYAALCRELGRPFAFPGQSASLLELVDTDLLAEAFAWAATEPAAADQTFNITNGDILVLAHAWPYLAERLKLPVEGEPPSTLSAFFAEPEVQSAWRDLAERHDLRFAELADLLGQSHHYVDLLLGQRLADKASPVLLDTIKIRRAGFHGFRDSRHSLMHWLQRMVELGLLPPLTLGAN
ncbi:NAD-dependent epimerase/dehydratase family protein [Brevundimonas sp.]|uniref:NAD-dependent epimerase/dehydratase family protein n=1 Tax=Brevundimonas sp. TaxID=1871086 RepID=UPI001A29BD57|nr:NAD-dependent epimerase/dehydratase family protein [Brevundimonas sp.]MBJ7483078.1 NAD-dependent epimerase/dehydratase family protein [Brevundimonas sp.]